MVVACHQRSLEALSPTDRLCWRRDAANIVEELFQNAPSETWNTLLDLRSNLLKGRDWNLTLDLFLEARELLEADQYLPFYRLRRLLSQSLRLETGYAAAAPLVESLADILKKKHRSLADIERAVKRECFEHALTQEITDLRVVESF